MKSALAVLLVSSACFSLTMRAVPACTATDTKLISRNISGGSGANGSAGQSLSANGRWVAFNSYTPDILATPVNMPGGRNVYVWDRVNNTYRAVDSAQPGQGLNDSIDDFGLSLNGRYVVFTTLANNVSGPDHNAHPDVYVKDLWTNTYDRVSRPDPSVGNIPESSHNSSEFSFSEDANSVAFISSGLVFTTYYFNASDPPVYNFHIYVRNRAGGTTQIVTRGRDANNNPQPLNGRVGRPAMAANGQLLVFSSNATNLENFRRTSTKRDLFVAISTGGQWNVVEQIPTEGNGVEDIYRDFVSISPDGRYVGYLAELSVGTYELYLYDRQTHQTIRPRPGGARPTFTGARSVSVGYDVVAWRDDLDLTGDGYSGGYWVRISTGTLQRIGREEDGDAACCGTNGLDGIPGGIVVSDDGNWATFSSASPRIDTPDGNGRHDVFVQKMTATADFGFACIGLNCQFDAAPTVSACAVTSWSWNFGDNTGASTSAPSHGYVSAGTRSVSLTVTDVNGVSSSVTKQVTVTNDSPSAALRYITVAPCRIWDSRDAATYPGAHVIASGESLVLSITNPRPACGTYPNARAVSVNLTAVQPSALGHLVAFATGTPSNSTVMNFATATSPRANNAIVPVGADGTITLKPFVLSSGNVHLIADVNGYFTDALPPPGVTSLGFQPLTPCRLHDSRFDAAPDGQVRPLNSGELRPITAQNSSKNCGIVSGAAAASLNVTAVTPSAGGHLTLFPNGASVPLVSNLNFNAGTTIANGARVSLAATTPDLGTQIVIPGGTAHLVVDTNGYFKSDAPLQFYPVTPCRALDTRFSPQGPALSHLEQRAVQIRGNCGVPADAKAAMLNLTVVGPTVSGHITAFPSGIGVPVASTINFPAGEPALANGSIVPLSTTLANDLTLQSVLPGFGTTHAILDVFGYFK